MLKEIIEIGKTVDDAIETACSKLGCQREDCEWEIVDLPKKTFFGLKSMPAKVRVSVELPDPVPVKQEQPPKPKEQGQPVKQQSRPAPPPQPIKRESRPAPTPTPTPAPAPEPAQAEVKPQERRPDRKLEKTYNAAEVESKSALAGEYVKSILDAMGLEANVSSAFEEDGIIVKIEGKGLGVMIGRRGETLDAVQYLTGLVVNRLEGDYMRITIDCGDYRLKRQKTLETLAERLASQVLKTNVSRTLEPMNPFERRIIHATVSGIEGVNSTSVGEEPNRRVVISTPTSRRATGRPDSRPVRRDGRFPDKGGDRGERRGGGPRDRGDRGERRGGGRGPARPKPEIPETPKATPEASVDANPLYAKIDLE